ncbi:MAG: GTPase domain-containing protein [Bacteroidetes bacterium]|nr:GTPase domain-containing protein [Bacteroidota bacterium]
MTGKCSNPECPAPPHCHDGKDDYKQCEFWLENNTEKTERKEKPQKQSKKTNLSWTGEPFKIEDIAQVSRRTTPLFLGVVGKADAGKTTFLAMLYTLLLRGEKFKEYDFTGTKTILGWDVLHHKLKVFKNKVSFPDPTPSQYYRLLHFALRNAENQLKDIFLSDVSGEVFTLWAQNSDDVNAENARWVYANSNGFILFIDCMDLIERRNLAKTEIIDIAQMLLHDLQERPVIVVWSKADKKEKVHQKIKDSLKVELQNLFTNYTEIDISNFSVDDPDKLVHENNLKVIDWLLSRIIVATGKELVIDSKHKNDLFLNFKGK